MQIPNGFVSSTLARQIYYDEEGRLKTFRVNTGPAGARSSDDPGIAEANSLYATDAEMFGSIAPFLKANRLRDAKRRNYIIQPGGACIYFQTERQLQDPYANGRVQYTAPSEGESFGHNSLDGTKMAGAQGRAFTIGTPGGYSQGPSQK